ncbi:hypothetical protein ACUTAF_02015 [Pseudomonas sp. SP16.1]|uniref:hypothetical protein n=1 Tax=Pseudomonas sp. SP16.1 TaxID=3458854 RepID=UPI004045E255
MSEQKMDAERAAFEFWWYADEQRELRISCAMGWGEYVWLKARARASLPVGVPDGLIDELRNHAAARTGYTCELLGRAADAFAAAPAAPTVKAEQVECNCPGGSKPDPASHAPNCPVRNGEPSTALPVAGVEEVEVVGYFTYCHDKKAWKQGKPKGPEFIHLFTPLMTVAQHNRIVAALSLQQAGAMSVPVELLRRVCWPVVSGSDRHTHSEAVAELRALLSSSERGGE